MKGRVRGLRGVARAALRAAAVLALALTFAGCGGGVSGAGGDSGDAPSRPKMVESGGAEFASSGGQMDMPGSGGRAAGQMAAQASASAQPASADEALPDDFDRRIVKTAELGVRAENVREIAAEAQRVAAGFGGNVLSSRVSRDDESVRADLVFTVPSQDFEVALDELRGLGKEVTDDAVRGEDVTEEFVDLESRERNLLAAEASLLELYDRAESVDDTLVVQRELTNVRGEIERVQGRLKYLEERTTSSRISLSIEPVPQPKPPPTWDPTEDAGRAWQASLAILQGMATAIISAAVFGWWLAPALIAGFVWWRRRNGGTATADSSG